MITLAARQRQLATAITGEDIDGPELEALLCKTPQGGKPRLDIYRNAFRARLIAALKENFPVLYRVLGDDAFADLGLAFIAARPSHTPSIRWFGMDLPEFLEHRADLVPHPSLADLARMEWALGTAFDAADAPVLAVSDLLTLSPEAWPSLGFVAHPTLRLVPLAWTVEPLWSALSVDENAETDAPEPAAHHLLVWRGEDRTHWRSVEAFEATMLLACIGGAPFAEMCELAAATAGERAAAESAAYLRTWIEAGLFTGIAGAD